MDGRVSGLSIALVLPYDVAFPGGVTEHVVQLERALRQHGHRTTVIAPVSARPGFCPPPNLVPVGGVVRVPTNGSVARITLSLGLSGTVARVLRAGRFDVVHLHEPFMPLLPFWVLRHSAATNVATFHAFAGNGLGYRHARPLLRRFFARLHGRIAVSESARSYVAQHFPAAYRVIPNGVDLERFESAAPVAGVGDGPPTVLFVGRLDERKGIRVLLRAFARLQRTGIAARLIVVGAYEAAERRRFERLAATLAVSNVVFAGWASPEELPRYYRTADVVCAPSTGGESFGIVLLEAMAAGKPIVASGIPGYREVLDHGVQGWLVPPADAEALADALQGLLVDPDLRLALGRRGQEKAARYAWPLVAERIESCYDEAMRAMQQPAARVSPEGGADRCALAEGQGSPILQGGD